MHNLLQLVPWATGFQEVFFDYDTESGNALVSGGGCGPAVYAHGLA